MERKIQPKINLPKIQKIPQLSKSVLPNGIDFYQLNIDNAEMVRLDFFFKGGAWVQNQPLQAMLALNCIKDGTLSKSAAQINELLDYHGATFNASANKMYGDIVVVCLAKHFDKVAQIVGDILRNPLYDDYELGLKLQQLWTNFEIEQQQVRPQAEKLFFSSFFGKRHPMTIFPEASDFNSINKDVVRNYFDSYIGAENSQIFLTGKISDKVVKTIENCFGRDKWGGKKIITDVDETLSDRKWFPVIAKQGVVNIQMEQKMIQSHIFAGFSLPKFSGKDKLLMALANCLIGGFFGSRLMKNIREEKGLTYGIQSNILATRLFNLFYISTDTRNDAAELVMKEINKEIAILNDVKISDDELNIVKNYYAGKLCRAYEASFNFVNIIMRKNILHESVDEVMLTQDMLADVNAEDLRDFIARYFAPERILYAVAGSFQNTRFLT